MFKIIILLKEKFHPFSSLARVSMRNNDQGGCNFMNYTVINWENNTNLENNTEDKTLDLRV